MFNEEVWCETGMLKKLKACPKILNSGAIVTDTEPFEESMDRTIKWKHHANEKYRYHIL